VAATAASINVAGNSLSREMKGKPASAHTNLTAGIFSRGAGEETSVTPLVVAAVATEKWTENREIYI